MSEEKLAVMLSRDLCGYYDQTYPEHGGPALWPHAEAVAAGARAALDAAQPVVRCIDIQAHNQWPLHELPKTGHYVPGCNRGAHIHEPCLRGVVYEVCGPARGIVVVNMMRWPAAENMRYVGGRLHHWPQRAEEAVWTSYQGFNDILAALRALAAKYEGHRVEIVTGEDKP